MELAAVIELLCNEGRGWTSQNSDPMQRPVSAILKYGLQAPIARTQHVRRQELREKMRAWLAEQVGQRSRVRV